MLENEMREWLLECFSSEDDQESIEQLNLRQLQKAINRYYDGGITEFINNSAIEV